MTESPHYLGHRQRLKEKFQKGGVLADYELLELLLFQAIPRADVKPLAKILLSTFGSIPAIFQADPSRLKDIKGIGDAVIHLFKLVHAISLESQQQELKGKDILSCEEDVLSYLKDKMGYASVEHLLAIFLDNKNAIIVDEVLQKGTVDRAPLYPREVLKRALEVGASSIILAHNHPSGDPTPSSNDLLSTEEVQTGARSLGINLHDHIIVGKDQHISMRALGIIE